LIIIPVTALQSKPLTTYIESTVGVIFLDIPLIHNVSVNSSNTLAVVADVYIILTLQFISDT
jgi:hypothetical protein